MKNLLKLASVVSLASLFILPVSAYARDGGRWVNLRLQPIGMINGEVMGDLNIAVLNFLSIGVIGYTANVNSNGGTANGSGYGARVDLLLAGKRFSNTWTMSAYGYVVPTMNLSVPFGGLTYTGSFSNISETGALIGYQWVYDSGFTMSMGLGPRFFNWPQPIVLTNGASTYSTSLPTVSAKFEFTFGFAF